MAITSSIESPEPKIIRRREKHKRYFDKMRNLRELYRLKVVLAGHFIGASGRHLDTYIDKQKIFKDKEAMRMIGKLFAESVQKFEFDIVGGPATGGNQISQLTMDTLFEDFGISSLRIPMKKGDEGEMLIRGSERVAGKRVIIVDDIATTGGSLRKAIRAVKEAGGEVVGAVVMINRDKKKITSKSIGVPLQAIFNLDLKSWGNHQVPQRLKNIPINTEHGHGKQWLQSKRLGLD